MKHRMFIGSSSEHLDLAYAVQENLEHDVEATVWTQGVFCLSRTALASLIDYLDECDCAVFVMSPDDMTSIRDKTVNTVRDNIIFELGLFIGRLGQEKCFMVVPRQADEFHLPTDLLGLLPATFDPDRQDKNLVAALGPACNRIKKSLSKLQTATRDSQVVATEKPVEAFCDDPSDCISLIQSWMGSRPADENTRAIMYADVDRVLKLAPGSARCYIEQAASYWGYRAARKGKDTILFEETRY